MAVDATIRGLALQGVKHGLRGLAHHSGLSVRLARRARVARVFMYHAVEADGLHPDVFQAQLTHLKRHFEPIALAELARRLRSDTLSGREAVITFDDGVRNHHRVVAPMLIAAGVPATFFVCPGLIEEGHWIWNMAMRQRLKSLPAADVVALARDIGDACQGSEDSAVEAIVAHAKTLPLAERQALERDVHGRTTSYVPSPTELERCAPMNWQELASLDPRWIDIGSHTLHHPIMTSVDAATLEAEVRDSRAWLERKLGRAVPHFCYPNGDHDAACVAAVKRHHEVAVTTQAGCVGAGTDLHRIARIPAAEEMALFAWRLHRPGA